MESAFEGATARPAFPSRRAGRLRRIAARLPIYAANVRDNPQWLAMFILGRLLPVRQALWRLSPDRDVHDCSRSMFPGSDAVVAVSELCREGLYCGLQLPESVWQAILGFGQETFCFGNMSRDVEFRPENHQEAVSLFNRPILTGHFFDRVEKCPAIVSVRDDPLLRAIAANYLGRKARVISTRLWWSFPASKASDSDLSLASQEKLHFDLDDWRALKFFFYLTPVDHDTGPHVYIRGTHNKRLMRHQWTLLVGHPNEEVLAAYGADNRTTVLGGAGHGFGVDPFGFHMGTAVRKSPRLMLEIGFGVSSVLGRRFHGEPGRQHAPA
jgi:hypothetical protein